MSNKILWIWYIAGALATLAVKYLSYVRHGMNMGKSWSAVTSEWFFEGTASNAVSWLATLTNFAVAWTVGRIYINKLALWDQLASLPLDNSISFLLGILAEVYAPNLAKLILAKLPKFGD